MATTAPRTGATEPAVDAQGGHATPGVPPTTTATARRLGRTPGSRFTPPDGAAGVGTGAAAKAVAQDLQNLVRAEIAYTKSELSKAAKAKAKGAGALAVAGVMGWLGLQGLLITIAFAIAAAGLPGWAAAGIVTLVLLLVAGVAALFAKRKLAEPLPLEPAKERVEEDVTWIKSHLPKE